jgi:uncharacterized protein YjiS (DUF1127 family)
MLTIFSGVAPVSPAQTPHAGMLRLMTGAAQFLSRGIEQRRQLRALAELDGHLLRDIGLEREVVRRACSQSFWL